MCMINAQIRDDVEKATAYVIRRVGPYGDEGGDEIRSPYQSYYVWEEEKNQRSSYTREEIEWMLKYGHHKLYGGVFHSFKTLDDAVDQLFEDFGFNGNCLSDYRIYQAVITGVIGDGLNSDERPCWFSTELELKKVMYRHEEV